MFVGSRRDVRQVLPVRRVFVVGVVALLCGVVGCTPGAQSAGSSAGGTVATVTQAEDPDGLAGSGIEGVLGSFQDGDVVFFYVLDELGVKNGLILPHDFVASADGRSMMQGGSVVANVGESYFFPGGWASGPMASLWNPVEDDFKPWVVGTPEPALVDDTVG